MIVTVQANQTLIDIALQCYGTFDGVWKLLADNAVLFDKNFYHSGVEIAEHFPVSGFDDITMPLLPGQKLSYDEKWPGADTLMLKKLKGAVPATAYAVNGDVVFALYYSPTGSNPVVPPPVFYNSTNINIISGGVTGGLLTGDSIVDMSEFGEHWDKRYYLGNSEGLAARWDWPFLHYNPENTYEWTVRELNYYYLQDMWLLSGGFDYCFAVLDYGDGTCRGLLELYISLTPLTDFAEAFKPLLARTDLVVTDTTEVLEDFVILASTIIQPGATLDIGTTFGHRLGIVSGTGTLYLERGELPAGIYDEFFSSAGGILEYGGAYDYNILGGITEINTLVLSEVGKNNRVFPNNDIIINGDFIIDGSLPLQGNSRTIYLHGNLTLNSTYFRFGINNIIAFVGNSDQVISGDFSETASLQNSFGSLLVDKPSGNLIINNSAKVKIEGNLDLSSGIIDNTGTGNIFLLNTSPTVNSSSSSYINGPLYKDLNSSASFEFPIGKDTIYRPIGIVNPTDNALWMAELIIGGGFLVDSSLRAITDTHYWEVRSDHLNMSGVQIKLSWHALDHIDDIDNVVVARLVNGSWVNIGGLHIFGDISGGTVVSEIINDFSTIEKFTIGLKYKDEK